MSYATDLNAPVCIRTLRVNIELAYENVRNANSKQWTNKLSERLLIKRCFLRLCDMIYHLGERTINSFSRPKKSSIWTWTTMIQSVSRLAHRSYHLFASSKQTDDCKCEWKRQKGTNRKCKSNCNLCDLARRCLHSNDPAALFLFICRLHSIGSDTNGSDGSCLRLVLSLIGFLFGKFLVFVFRGRKRTLSSNRGKDFLFPIDSQHSETLNETK